MKKLFITIIVSLLIGSCSDAINDLFDELNAAVPVCVDSTSTAIAPDGRGWKNAYPSIEAAVASPRVQDGAAIWVKAGTYIISTTISITKSISIYGGFNGTEEKLNERNINTNIATVQPSGGGNAFTITGFQGNLVIDGFTFTGSGKAFSITNSPNITISYCIFSSLISTTSGGAIYISDSSITFNNCSFYNNSSNSVGGVIYATSNTSTNLSISHCSFTNNYGNTNGGAISTYSPSGTINLTITNNSKFETNWTSNSNGGAIYCGYGTSAYIYNSEFSSNGSTLHANGASSGGAIYFNLNSYCIISDCNFNENDSTAYGGAISISASPDAHVINSNFNNNTTAYMSGGGGAIGVFDSTSNVYIDNSEFASNSTIGSGSISDGGAIYCYLGSTNISSCKFNSNIANNSSGGAIFARTGVLLSVVNSWFYNNEANGVGVAEGMGGALFIENNSTHTFDNLTFYSNIASDNGGAIFFANSAAPTIYNSVFFNNTATNAGKNIYSFSATTLQYCFYNNGLSGLSIGSGCINNSSSPFVSVTSTSSTFLYPANIIIDVGSNSGIPAGVTIDLAGNPRIVNSIVDIGAYEAQ